MEGGAAAGGEDSVDFFTNVKKGLLEKFYMNCQIFRRIWDKKALDYIPITDEITIVAVIL